MRVLMVSKACLVGAYQTKLESIAQNVDIELAVIVPTSWRDPAGTIELERDHTEGYQLFVDPIRFNGHYHLHYYPKLKNRLKDFGPDILHIDEEPYNLATWKALRDSRSAGCKTLFFSWQNIDRRYPWPFQRMERTVLREVDFAIVGNNDSLAIWQSKGYSGPSVVIPQFGVSMERFHRRETDRSTGEFIIGSAGRRLVYEKGIDLLLKAAVELPGFWKIKIAGEGPERSRLEQLARELEIEDRVHFDGVITSDEMPEYLNQLDVLVLASRTIPRWKEQFGRVLIEAMACEIPVVGSDSGEIPHVIGSSGLVFPEGDWKVLRDHLLRLMEDSSLRNQLGQQGYERVVAQFTQKQVATKTVDVYRKMMAVDD